MSNQQPQRKPKHLSRYGGQPDLPKMATPRRPEPPQKMGFLGFLFIIGIFSGVIWLIMLVFGLGPYEYEHEVGAVTPNITGTLPLNIPPIMMMSPTATPNSTATRTPTPTPTATIVPTQELLPYIQFGEPETMKSTIIRRELGCEWLVIAGQVWDLQGEPVTGLTLHLYGTLAGFSIDEFRQSGSATTYGPSGYEFALEDMVVDSTYSLYIQLLDSDGYPLSHPVAIETYQDCERNMILINFNQVR